MEKRTVPRGVFRVVAFEMGIRNVMQKKIWNDYCSNRRVILVSRNTGRKFKVQSDLVKYADFLVEEKTSISIGDTQEKSFMYVDKEFQNNLFFVIFRRIGPATTLAGA